MIKTMSTVVPMNLTVNHVQGGRNLFAYHLTPGTHYSKLMSKQHGQSSLFLFAFVDPRQNILLMAGHIINSKK